MLRLFTRLMVFILIVWPESLLAEGNVFKHPVSIGDDLSPFWRVAEKLNEARVARGNFRQEKQIKVLKKPLLSSGKYISSADNGLYWKVEEPFRAETLFGNDGVFQRYEDGDWSRIFPEGQEMAQRFMDMLRAVFAGSRQQLVNNFDIYFEGDPQNWTIGLVPKRSEMKRFMHHIVLGGKELIERLEILEAGGDKALITFSDLSSSEVLTLQEERCFER